MLKKEKSSPYAFKIFDFNKKAPLVGPCMRSLGTHRKQKDRKALFLCGEGSVSWPLYYELVTPSPHRKRAHNTREEGSARSMRSFAPHRVRCFPMLCYLSYAEKG